MQSNLLQVCRRFKGCAYIIFLLTIGTPLPAQETLTYPIVQLDLNAGNFLNALPFDRPFIIQGYASQDVPHIAVTFEEFLDVGHLFATHPKHVAAFETDVKETLETVLLDPNTSAGEKRRTLERRLEDLLWQHTTSAGGGATMKATHFLPWNWGRSVIGKRSKATRPLTTGTLFDASSASKKRFRKRVESAIQAAQKNEAIDQLTSLIVREAQNIQIASVPTSPPQTIRATWHKLHNEQSIHQKTLPINAPSRWNQLEQRLQGQVGSQAEAFRLVVPPLNANRTYLVHIDTKHNTATDSVEAPPVTKNFWVDTQSNDYVSLDVGLLHAREIKETSIYIGTNIYLRPVDKGVPLQTRGGFLRRFAFTIGLAVQDIEDDRSTRRALIGPLSVVLGGGLRVSKYVRLGGGILVFRERDPETFPLTTRTSLTGSPYVSAAFDMDVGKQLKGLGSLFGIVGKGGGE